MKVRIDIGIRNGEIVKRREALGHDTTASLSRACGISQSDLCKMQRLSYDPRRKVRGEGRVGWKRSAVKLAAYLRCLPEDLWPEEYSPQRIRTVSLDAEVVDVGHMVESLTPVALLEAKEEATELRELMDEIPERARTALEMRADGATFREIGDVFGVGVQRARQIYRQGARAIEYRAVQHGGALAERARIAEETEARRIDAIRRSVLDAMTPGVMMTARAVADMIGEDIEDVRGVLHRGREFRYHWKTDPSRWEFVG